MSMPPQGDENGLHVYTTYLWNMQSVYLVILIPILERRTLQEDKQTPQL